MSLVAGGLKSRGSAKQEQEAASFVPPADQLLWLLAPATQGKQTTTIKKGAVDRFQKIEVSHKSKPVVALFALTVRDKQIEFEVGSRLARPVYVTPMASLPWR